MWQGLTAILVHAETAALLGFHPRFASVIEIKMGPGWTFEFLFGLAMDIVASIDIEWVAIGLAGLVLIQLFLELNGIYRRSGGASRRGVFLQVQGRRMPAAEADTRMQPLDPAGPEGVRD